MTDPAGSKSLFPQEIWDRGYEHLEFSKPRKGDQLQAWMERFLTERGGSALEVGCFPGRYLAVCGAYGYELNGIDLAPRVDAGMVQWLKTLGFDVGTIERGDFFALPESRKYDLVYSHGFVEHFSNWHDVVKKHASLVKPGGIFLVSVPNFLGGLQRFLHRILDKDNLDRHCLDAMDPARWIPFIGEDFEILYCGYFDVFDFWIGEQERSLLQRVLFLIVRASLPILRQVLPRNRRFSSPFCGLAARKRI